MPAYALLALLGGGYVTGSYLNGATVKNEDLDPKIAGQSAQMVTGLAGLGLMLLGGPIMGPLGAGAVIGSAVSYDAAKRFKTGLESFVEEQIKAYLSTEQGRGLPSISELENATEDVLSLLHAPG